MCPPPPPVLFQAEQESKWSFKANAACFPSNYEALLSRLKEQLTTQTLGLLNFILRLQLTCLPLPHYGSKQSTLRIHIIGFYKIPALWICFEDCVQFQPLDVLTTNHHGPPLFQVHAHLYWWVFLSGAFSSFKCKKAGLGDRAVVPHLMLSGIEVNGVVLHMCMRWCGLE